MVAVATGGRDLIVAGAVKGTRAETIVPSSRMLMRVRIRLSLLAPSLYAMSCLERSYRVKRDRERFWGLFGGECRAAVKSCRVGEGIASPCVAPFLRGAAHGVQKTGGC